VMDGLYDAAVLAFAGLHRLEMDDQISQILPLDVMLPAPGQGALGIQCRSADEQVLTLLDPINDSAVRHAVTAERTFLSTLEGGCSAPIGAYATATDSGAWQMESIILSPDGQTTIRLQGQDDNAAHLGRKMAQQALEQGAGDILG